MADWFLNLSNQLTHHLAMLLMPTPDQHRACRSHRAQLDRTATRKSVQGFLSHENKCRSFAAPGQVVILTEHGAQRYGLRGIFEPERSAGRKGRLSKSEYWPMHLTLVT